MIVPVEATRVLYLDFGGYHHKPPAQSSGCAGPEAAVFVSSSLLGFPLSHLLRLWALQHCLYQVNPDPLHSAPWYSKGHKLAQRVHCGLAMSRVQTVV